MDGDFDKETGEIDPLNQLRVVGWSPPPHVPPAIAAAIIAVKKQIKALGSDERNEHGRYGYVSVDKFYERIGKLMAEAGLALLIDETSTDVRAGEQRDRDKAPAPWLFAQYTLSFMHESGALSAGLRRSIALPISGPQAFGAAQSYIEKQFLRQVFKVPTGEKDADDAPTDGIAPETRNAARGAQERPPAARAPQRQQAAPAPSEAKEDASKRWKELRDAIDAAKDLGELDGIAGCPAWIACAEKIMALDGSQEKSDQMMAMLHERIEGQRQYLVGSA